MKLRNSRITSEMDSSVYDEELVEKLAELGYVELFYYGDYGYDWTITKVFQKDGRVFDLTDNGCSCSDYGDGWWTPEAAVEALVELQSLPSLDYIKNRNGYFSDDSFTVQENYRKAGLR